MTGQRLRLTAARDQAGVTHANWQDPPFNRWAFLHLDEQLTMAPREWAERVTITDGSLVEAFFPAPEAALYPGAMYHDLWWVISPAREIFVALGIYGQMLLVHRSASAVVAKFSTQPKPVDLESDYLQITASIALCDALAAGLA